VGAFALSGEERRSLRAALQRLEGAGAPRTRRVRPLLEVDVDYHGRQGRPLRDPVPYAVTLADRPLTTTS